MKKNDYREKIYILFCHHNNKKNVCKTIAHQIERYRYNTWVMTPKLATYSEIFESKICTQIVGSVMVSRNWRLRRKKVIYIYSEEYRSCQHM